MSRVVTIKGSVLLGENFKAGRDGSLQTSPGFMGVSEVPQSPVIVDTQGSKLDAIELEYTGASRVELWRSTTSNDPVNQAALASGAETVPDYSEVKWRYVGELNISDEGTYKVTPTVLQELSRGRYIKIEKTHGKELEYVHIYAT